MLALTCLTALISSTYLFIICRPSLLFACGKCQLSPMKNQSVALQPGRRLPSSTIPIDPVKLIYSIVDVICAIDEQGIFRYVSPSSIKLFGYSPEEMTGIAFVHFIHPDDIDRTVQVVSEKTHDCSTSNFENRYYCKDGSLVDVIWSGRWDENDKLLYCVARDGSEKSEIERRLLKAQQMARVANYEFDIIEHRYTYASDTLFEIFGLDKTKHPVFTSGLFWSLLHPDDLDFARKNNL